MARLLRSSLFAGLSIAAVLGEPLPAQTDSPLGWDPYFTLAGNFEGGYRKTQFFQQRHDVGVGTWDARAEVWLPPFRNKFAWGPYIRFAGVAASKPEAWENGLLGNPGVGLQAYPFSSAWLSSPVARVLGPTRLFAERNRMNYWGKANEWRPRVQTRIGAEHWRSNRVNDPKSAWWMETWNGLWWQSANEFSPQYRSMIFANAIRAGARPGRTALTPYVALESSLTDNRAYYWENRLLVGGGVRFAPRIADGFQRATRLNRFAVFAEYLHIATYYRLAAPRTIPDHEVRVGVTFSSGLWYR